MTSAPYNPLDKVNLAKSIEIELLGRQPVPFSELTEVRGAGIYVIYYVGDFSAYAPIVAPECEQCVWPAYLCRKGDTQGRSKRRFNR